ncbi:MAG: Flp family type IVb pilin [Dermatophilaceae bacterium]|nr:Flp family type IVb pilin [Dermatophilaceae bacterium]
MTGLYATLFSLYTVTKDRLTNEERGATAVEYGLMVGLIAVAIIVAVTTLGTKLSTLFTSVSGKLPTV